jgi:hypothetical protein
VCVVLIVQSVFFCLPNHIWNKWQGSSIFSLVQDLKVNEQSGFLPPAAGS